MSMNDGPIMSPEQIIEATARELLPLMEQHERDLEQYRRAGRPVDMCVHGVEITRALMGEIEMCQWCQVGATLREFALDVARARYCRERVRIAETLRDIALSPQASLLQPAELMYLGQLMEALQEST